MPIRPELATIWAQFKPRTLDRLTTLDEAARALRAGSLGDELRQRAQHEAHTLAGSIGSVGFFEGSRLARQAERLLQDGAELGPAQAQTLMALAAALRRQ